MQKKIESPQSQHPDTEKSLSERLISPEGENEDVSYKFLFVNHTPENAPDIAKQLTDCDVIAFEAVGDTGDRRGRLETVFTQLLDEQLPEETRQGTLEMLGEDYFIGAVLDELAGTNKQVKLIDISESDEKAMALDKISSAREKEFYKAIADHEPNDDLKDRLVAYMKGVANSSAKREEVMAQQLAAMQDAEENEGKKIGVVIGAIHTPVHHMVNRQASTERVFVDDSNPAGPRERYRYDPSVQAIRQFRFRPDAELDPAFLDRELVKQIFYTYNFSEEDEFSEAYSRGRRGQEVDEKIVSRMSDDEVEELLGNIDAIKKRPSRRIYFTAGRKAQDTQEKISNLLVQYLKSVE